MNKKIKTMIKAGMIIACQKGEHRILENGCIVLRGNEIIYVGKKYNGEVDETINAANRVITPGFINCHTHFGSSPLDKSYKDDVGERQFYYSSLPYLLTARTAATDIEAKKACVDYSMIELIRTGTTTVMENDNFFIYISKKNEKCFGDYTADSVERVGLRAYIGPMYRSGKQLTRDGKKVEYEWDYEKGEKDFSQAVDFIERIKKERSDRIRGFLSPATVDTCTEDLLKMTKQKAEELNIPISLHASQAVYEVQEMMKRYGMTSIEWLNSIGFLDERCILAHAIYTTGNSWLQYSGNDVGILADNNMSIVYCVWVFAKYGIVLENFSKYKEAGVNICFGTDTSPQSIIEGIRWTAVTGKIMSRDIKKPTAADVFNAVTLNAAKYLKRDDLGKIEKGAKADLLFWDTSSMFMVPLRDPIKNIVYGATTEDLKEVMIDGKWVMKNGQVLGVDEEEVCYKLQINAERVWQNIKNHHFANKTIDEISPMSFKDFEDE